MFDWQNIIALTLVGLAAAYLLSKIWLRFVGRSTGACDTCSSCTATAADDFQTRTAKPLVQVKSQYDHQHDGTHGPTDHITG